MEVRALNEKDAAALWNLRLEAMQNNPEAFGASYEETLATPLARIEQRLAHGFDSSNDFVLGNFEEGLLGMVGFIRQTETKLKHRGSVWGMYVTPQVRGKGYGKILMNELIARAKAQGGLEIIKLSVSAHNTAARELYLSLGFKPYGLESKGLKIGDKYIDLELMQLEL